MNNLRRLANGIYPSSLEWSNRRQPRVKYRRLNYVPTIRALVCFSSNVQPLCLLKRYRTYTLSICWQRQAMSHRSVTVVGDGAPIGGPAASAICKMLCAAREHVRPRVIAYGCVFTGDLMPLPSGDDLRVVTHDSCLISNPPLVPFLRHDDVGIDERRYISAKYKFSRLYHRKEPRLARIRCCLRFSRFC